MKYDLGNLLCMFDESLDKLIKHLESGYPDRALVRAKETKKVIEKLKCHCVDQTYTERKL
jgi:hypothetical protein